MYNGTKESDARMSTESIENSNYKVFMEVSSTIFRIRFQLYYMWDSVNMDCYRFSIWLFLLAYYPVNHSAFEWMLLADSKNILALKIQMTLNHGASFFHVRSHLGC